MPSKKLKTGYLVQERAEGVPEWFNVNGYFYETPGQAIEIAARRVVHDKGIAESRVVEFKYYEPIVYTTIKGADCGD